MQILTILGSKGGIGKSTLASNLLVAARLDGINAVGVDLDAQGSLVRWAEARAEVGHEPAVTVVSGRMPGWRLTLPDCSLAIVDTPPGLEGEDAVAALRELAMASDLVLMPALPEEATLLSLGGPGAALVALGAPVAAVLNRVVRGGIVLPEARAYLAQRVELCPIEVPQRADVQRALGRGLGVVEDSRLGGAPEMRALWQFTAARLGLA